MTMIEKALIPIAGLGTRLRPLSSVVPKAFWPLADSRCAIRPVLHYICTEAKAAGIEELGVIVSPWQEPMCREYFKTARDDGAADLPHRIEHIVQPSPAGFGHAVACGAEFVGDRPFVLLLGDHVHVSCDDREACSAQVTKAFEACGGCAMIGMQTADAEELSRVGVGAGEAVEELKGVYRCRAFVEKPTLAQARAELTTPGLDDGKWLAHCGIYAFTAEIFDCLAELTAQKRDGEIQLADAQSILLQRHPNDYYLLAIRGETFDTGMPQGYARTFQALRQMR